MCELTHSLAAKHFWLEHGCPVKVCEEKPVTRRLYLSCRPDPVRVHDEGTTIPDPDAFCVYLGTGRVSGLFSLYREERRFTGGGADMYQSIAFYVLAWQREGRVETYLGLTPVDLADLLRWYAMPAGSAPRNSISLVLSSSLVGYLFHEYCHLLEADVVGTEQVHALLGRKVFPGTSISVAEDPAWPTPGFHAFSDEGRVAVRTWLIRNGVVTGCLDSEDYPINGGRHGMVGYAPGRVPLPRSCNLVVEAEALAETPPKYLLLTGGTVELLDGDPTATVIRVEVTEGVYVEENHPRYRVPLAIQMVTTVQELSCRLTFLSGGACEPRGGGLCLKNGIPLRAAQTAPCALLATKL